MVLGDRRQNTIPAHDLVAEAASSALERMKRCLAKRVREVMMSPCSSPITPCVDCCVHFWALTGEGLRQELSQCLETGPITARKLCMTGSEFSEESLRCSGAGTLSWEGKLRARPLFSLHKGRPWEPPSDLPVPTGRWSGG